MKTISIIVPIYKGNRYVNNLIKMIEENCRTTDEKQNISMELILVNDFPAEALNYQKPLSNKIRIFEVRNKENMGIHASRVQGLMVSNGEYIVFLDQDDIISSVYLKEQLKHIEDYDAVVCNGKNQGLPIYRSITEQRKVLDIREYKNGNNRIVSPGQVILRRRAIPDLWVKDILKNNGADDYYLWFLMLLENKKIKLNPKILYLHVTTEENTSNNEEMMRASVNEMILNLEENKLLSTAELINLREKRMPKQLSGNIVDKYNKINSYLHLEDCWLSIIEEGKRIADFFEKNGFHSIAIYGLGILGKHLERQLRKTDIQVRYMIDQNSELTWNDKKVKAFGEPIEWVDVIVVTPIYDYKIIKKRLQMYYKYEIISLETVIKNIDISLE